MNASEPKSKNQTDLLNDKQNIPVESNKDTRYRLKAGTFLTVIGGFGFLAGFGGAVAAVKKQDPSSFDHGLTTTNLAKAKQVCSSAHSIYQSSHCVPYLDKSRD